VAGRSGGDPSVGRRRLPEDTEARLVEFTPLLATAIANAESHSVVVRLAEEHAALRRVATLVAREVAQPELFNAIADELRLLIGMTEVRMLRFDGDHSAVVVGCSGSRDVFGVGSRQHLIGDSAVDRIFRTGRTVRIDDYATVSGPVADTARSIGIRAVVAAPIVVNGRLWGAITTGSTNDDPLPPEAESRLAEFTDLLATAIANAESGAEVRRLADEQAALQRVATLVSQAAAPAEIFAAVSVEVDPVRARCDTATSRRPVDPGEHSLSVCRAPRQYHWAQSGRPPIRTRPCCTPAARAASTRATSRRSAGPRPPLR
jgi:hypothetical protein